MGIDMANSFTPGPWRVGKKYTSSVYAGNMQGIRIAACFDDDVEANARLIASAPELLEALKWALTQIGASEPNWEFYKQPKRQQIKQLAFQTLKMKAARAAIKKATA